MAFVQNWVESDPDGSIITGSLLDDWIRFTKVAIRERLEGDATLNLTGLIEAGSWIAAPMPKVGSARAWAVTAANLGTVPLQDGRMAITTDTHRMYHMATAGFYELDYLSKVAGGVVTGVTTFSGGIIGTVAGNATSATALATPRAINGVNFDGTAAITVPAAAGTLTGAALAAGVTVSSLTSVGTLVSLSLNAGGGQTIIINGNNAVGAYIDFRGLASTARGFMGNGSSIFAGGAITDFGLASEGGDIVFATSGGVIRGRISNATGVLTITAGFVGAITGNVTGNVTGTILTAAQPNITSVGTLTVLSVTGLITAPGGIDITGVGVQGLKGLIATGLGVQTTQCVLALRGVGSPIANATQQKWLPIMGHDAVQYYIPAFT